MKSPALHERIRREIEGQILSGAWPPGARVPGEIELMAQYGCARMTVNKALSALAHAGLVERRRRAGTFVARPRSQSMVLEITDLAREVTARGQTYSWQLLSRRETMSALPEMPGPVLEVEGVHFADGTPLAFEHRLVSTVQVAQVLTADLATTAPGTWLLGHVPWTEAENRISATAATPVLARRANHDPTPGGSSRGSADSWNRDSARFWLALDHHGDAFHQPRCSVPSMCTRIHMDGP